MVVLQGRVGAPSLPAKVSSWNAGACATGHDSGGASADLGPEGTRPERPLVTAGEVGPGSAFRSCRVGCASRLAAGLDFVAGAGLLLARADARNPTMQ